MAVSKHTTDTLPRPRWPARPFDPARAFLCFDRYADDLVVYFADRAIPSYSDPIDVPEGDDVAVLVRLEDDWASTGEIVGVHIYPFLVGVARAHPAWRVLAEPNPPPEAVASFVAEVGALFARYGVGEE